MNPELALTHLVGQFPFPHLNLDLIPKRTTLFGKSCRNHIFHSFLKFPRKSINGKARNLNNQQQCHLACISLPYIDWTSYHSSAGGNTFLIAYRHQVLTYLPDSANIHIQFVWHVCLYKTVQNSLENFQPSTTHHSFNANAFVLNVCNIYI